MLIAALMSDLLWFGANLSHGHIVSFIQLHILVSYVHMNIGYEQLYVAMIIVENIYLAGKPNPEIIGSFHPNK